MQVQDSAMELCDIGTILYFRYEKALKTHVATHGAMKKCELCCQTFRSEEELTNHPCLPKRREQNPDVNYSESRINKKITGKSTQSMCF